jgi:hypothetical protein
VDEVSYLVEVTLPDNPLYWFVVEESPEGRIHVHSAFCCTEEQSVELEAALKKRFCKGLEKTLWGHNRPIVVRPIYNSKRWVKYCVEDMDDFRIDVGVRKSYYISKGLKALVKKELENDSK